MDENTTRTTTTTSSFSSKSANFVAIYSIQMQTNIREVQLPSCVHDHVSQMHVRDANTLMREFHLRAN